MDLSAGEIGGRLSKRGAAIPNVFGLGEKLSVPVAKLYT